MSPESNEGGKRVGYAGLSLRDEMFLRFFPLNKGSLRFWVAALRFTEGSWGFNDGFD